MARVLADHHDPAITADHFALFADLLDARLALHRVTGTSSDGLTLQEQDAVAEMLTINQSADPADDLIRSLAESARAVTWITSDAWRRVGSRPRRSP